MSKIKSIIAAFAVMLPFLFTSCDKDVKVSGVQITPEEVTLGTGETQKLTVTSSLPTPLILHIHWSQVILRSQPFRMML